MEATPQPAFAGIEERLANLQEYALSPAGQEEARRRREEAKQQAQVERRDQERKRLEGAHCPERHMRADIPDPEAAFGEMFAKYRDRLGRGFIALLTGNRGIGKTQFAIELVKVATLKRKARYIKAARMFAEIRSAYNRGSKVSELDVIDEFIKPSLLVIDEFGKFTGTDWEMSMWQLLIDERYDAMKDTILISNQTLEQAIESMGASAASRLKEVGFVNECKWKGTR